MAKIFRIKVVGKGGDEEHVDVQAKDDVQGRTKAVKIWVRRMNTWLRKARAQDKEDGESTLPADAYTEKDVSYCETSLLTETDE